MARDTEPPLADWGVDDDGVPVSGEGDEREEVLPQFFELNTSKTRFEAERRERTHRLCRCERVVRHFNGLAHGGGTLADAVVPQKDARRLNERGLLNFGGVNRLRVLDRLGFWNFYGINLSELFGAFCAVCFVPGALSFL